MAERSDSSEDSDLDDCTDLESEFKMATKCLRSVLDKATEDDLLYFYARYKQATEGPCKKSKPKFYDFEGKRKWESWKAITTMPKNDAMQQYIDKLTHINPEWKFIDPNKGKNKESLGPVFSRLANSDESDTESDPTVFDIVKDGKVEELNSALSNGNLDINVKDDNGMTLLHWACDRGNLGVVNLLLKQGSDVNLQDGDGQTALHYASSCGHYQVVEELMKHSADMNIADSNGDLPKDIALTADIGELLVSR